MRLRAGAAALAVALVLVLGCSTDGPGIAAPMISVRDSADVRIVEHGPGALAAAEEWALADDGADVGGANGLAGAAPESEAHELTRVLAAAVLPGDTIVVVDGGAGELRYFGPDGRHVRTVGRSGDGPGEFGALLTAPFLPPDTIAAWDFRNQRIVLVDGGGRFVTEIPIGAGVRARGLTILTRLPGGDWAGRTRNLWYLAAEALPGSTIRDSVSYVRISAAGNTSETVTSLPNHVLDVRPRTIAGRTQRLAFPMMFSPRGHVEGGAGRVVTGVADRFEVTAYRADGGRALLRLDIPSRPVTAVHVDAEIEAMRERLAGRPADEVERELRALRETPAVENFPAFDRVRAGSDGSIWIRRFVAPGDPTAVWAIFAPDGRLRATLPTNPDAELLQASLEQVVLLLRDELDVESVVRRRLVERGEP